ncbi:MAG TPA: hypothetical protein VNL94_08600, partial [Candidatus Binatia bacterium]|nr:hypothetical protein [Candidatus Binatia bacterium]
MGALPAGSRILHIGPHKTGTTSVQSAFHLARAAAAAQGVHYAGSERHSVVAVQAAIEPGRARPAALRRWGRLVGEIERSTAERVVLSSEWFADAGPEAIRRIVADVGSERVRVVVTVRSLERVLPSQWQQYVAAGLEAGYEPWLRSIFQGDGTSTSPTFWHRHRHDRLIERWASVVGAENVTAIVVDDADHGAVLRAFEGLTGLRTGTLVAERDRANRSLTLPEAEVVRAFNVELNREIEAHNVRLNLGLYGATAALRARTPDAAEPRIETPAWALERAAEVAREIVAGIRAAGVEVVGDLESLAFDPPARAEAASDAADTDALAVVPDSTWLEIAS